MSIGAIVFLIFVVEFLPDAIKHFRRRGRKIAKIDDDYRSKADFFKSVDWGNRYFCEYWAATRNADWHPYIYGRCHKFAGEFINVDKKGLRKTWNSFVDPSAENTLKIFFFGGSTGWGMGARDDHTVPSELSRMLSDTMSCSVEVTNFSENGYVATQSLLMLMLELRRGNIPDAVLFYDGVNDSFSAFQNGRPGVPQNEYNRSLEFNILHPSYRLRFYKSAAKIVLRRTLRLIDKIAGRTPDKLASKATTEQNEELALGVLQVYSDIVHTVRSLGKRYNFKSSFFWQPSIYSKKFLSDYEASEKETNIRYSPLISRVNSMIGKFPALSLENNFYEIQDIFDERQEGTYLDFAHISEDGNRLVAEAMIENFFKNMKNLKPREAPFKRF